MFVKNVDIIVETLFGNPWLDNCPIMPFLYVTIKLYHKPGENVFIHSDRLVCIQFIQNKF